jgi:hypothetical protein
MNSTGGDGSGGSAASCQFPYPYNRSFLWGNCRIDQFTKIGWNTILLRFFSAVGGLADLREL